MIFRFIKKDYFVLFFAFFIFCIFIISDTTIATTLQSNCRNIIGQEAREALGLCDTGQVGTFFPRIFSFVSLMLVPLLATIMTLLGAYLIIVNGGENPEKSNTGKKYIKYSVIGLIVVSMSSIIISFFISIVGASDEVILSFDNAIEFFGVESEETGTQNQIASVDNLQERPIQEQPVQIRPQGDDNLKTTDISNDTEIEITPDVASGGGLEQEDYAGIDFYGGNGVQTTDISNDTERERTPDSVLGSGSQQQEREEEKTNSNVSQNNQYIGGGNNQGQGIPRPGDIDNPLSQPTLSTISPIRESVPSQSSIQQEINRGFAQGNIYSIELPPSIVSPATCSIFAGVKKNVCNNYESLVRQYFGRAQTKNAIRIISCESGGNPNISTTSILYTDKNGNRRISNEDSVGLFQVNLDVHGKGVSQLSGISQSNKSGLRNWLSAPENNIRYASLIYKSASGKGLSQWWPWCICGASIGQTTKCT